MTCSTRACCYPATHGKLCSHCSRMLQEPGVYQQLPHYSGPSRAEMDSIYDKNRSKRQKEKRTGKTQELAVGFALS